MATIQPQDQWMIDPLYQKYLLPVIDRASQDREQSRLSSLSSVSTRSSASPSNHHPFSRPDSALSQYQTPGGSSCTSLSDPNLNFSANLPTLSGNSLGYRCDLLNSDYATYSPTLAPTLAPIFAGPPGAEQTLDHNARPDQILVAKAPPILNASRKLFFCTYEAEEGKTKHFGAKSDWKKHEKNFHETGKEYRCPNSSCSQTFSRKRDYFQHCKRHKNLNALPARKMMRELSQKTAFGCGFNHCKTVCYSWNERCNHLAGHMQKESKTPSDWCYSNVIRNLLRQQNIQEISKRVLDQFCQQKKIDRSRLSWFPSNTKELRQSLECSIFYPNGEVFVQKAMKLSSLGALKSPNQAIALSNRFTMPSQDSAQSADTSGIPQIQDFPIADYTDFGGSTQFDPSRLASQLQLLSPHNMGFPISHSSSYEHDPDSFRRTQSGFEYLNLAPMLTEGSFFQPSQTQAESNLDSQFQYQQNDFPVYSNQEQPMHPLLTYSGTAALGFNSVTSSCYPGNHNEEVTDIDDGVYKP